MSKYNAAPPGSNIQYSNIIDTGATPTVALVGSVVGIAWTIINCLLYAFGSIGLSSTTYLLAASLTIATISPAAGALATLAIRERVSNAPPKQWLIPPVWLSKSVVPAVTLLVVIITIATHAGYDSHSSANALGHVLSFLAIPLVALIATLRNIFEKTSLFVISLASYTIEVAIYARSPLEITIAITHLILLIAAAIALSFLSSSIHVEANKKTEEETITLEKAKLWNEIAHRAHEIATYENPEQVQKAVVDTTIALGYHTSAITVINRETNTFRYVFPRNLPTDMVDKDIQIRGLTKKVLASHDTEILDYEFVEDKVPSFAQLGIRTSVGIPIWNSGEIIAVLIAGSLVPRDIFAEELAALELLATTAAASMEHQKITSSLVDNLTRLHSMLENAPSATIILDEDQIILANKRCDLLFGYDRHNLLNMNLDEFILDTSPISLLNNGQYIDDSINGFTTTARCSDETHIEVEISASKINLQNRNLIAVSFRDISELRKLETKLLDRESYDQLTGLANRQKFIDELRRALSRNTRTKVPVTLVVFEIDRYSIGDNNTTTTTRDTALIAIVKRIENYTRDIDLLARIGGDKFAVLIEDLSDAESLSYIHRLLRCARDSIEIAGISLRSNAYFGVAIASPGITADSLLQRANSALLHAKVVGANNIVYADESIRTKAEERIKLEANLQKAVRNREFQLEYQPIFNIHTNKIKGAEALLRWKQPGHGKTYPEVFIPAAEESGLVVPIGNWVFREACSQLAKWRSQHPLPQNFTLSVNVSRVQLENPQIINDFESALSDFKIEPSQITIEITETALLRDTDTLDKVVEDLASLGLLVAIDDFGTGYSSLSMLANLPINVIKIDKSFVDQLGTKTDFAIEAVINMATHLELNLVCEGVETQEQVDKLIDLGCHYAQGYYFQRPVPPEEISLSFQ